MPSVAMTTKRRLAAKRQLNALFDAADSLYNAQSGVRLALRSLNSRIDADIRHAESPAAKLDKHLKRIDHDLQGLIRSLENASSMWDEMDKSGT